MEFFFYFLLWKQVSNSQSQFFHLSCAQQIFVSLYGKNQLHILGNEYIRKKSDLNNKNLI